MTIQRRILIHLIVTLLLLAAASCGVAFQWDTMAEMQGLLERGREAFHDLETLRSRFESLNIGWKAMAPDPDPMEGGDRPQTESHSPHQGGQEEQSEGDLIQQMAEE